MRLYCLECAKAVSTEVPDGTIIRAWLVCPECLEKLAADGKLRMDGGWATSNLIPERRSAMTVRDRFLSKPWPVQEVIKAWGVKQVMDGLDDDLEPDWDAILEAGLRWWEVKMAEHPRWNEVEMAREVFDQLRQKDGWKEILTDGGKHVTFFPKPLDKKS